MRQHKLALCGSHFLGWIPEQTQRFIDKYKMFGEDSRILVAVSGGKDSLALWDVLHQLGYQTTGLYIGLGINDNTDYSEISHRMAEKFAIENNLELILVDVADAEGATIPEASKLTERGKRKPCSVCGLTKRYLMNRAAQEGGYDVLVTGHNLDDEAAVLFGNTINWAVGYLARQGPVLEETADGLVRKAKPFCRFYERETAAYALLREIDYIYDECPYAEGATSIYYKELLNQMEEVRPGMKLSFYLSFLRAKKSGLFVHESTLAKSELANCHTCGQPTTAPDQCAYCRTWEKVRSRRAVA
jgi:uncharacterized protein (TIGR00269 family)